LSAATVWLDRNAESINALNVFPVPDGDTGNNMLLTMQAAVRETNRTEERSISAVMQAAAYGSLMGARGNSGVILSQLLRGMARQLDKRETIDAPCFARALQEAAHTAYKGVIKPVEGTMLTVAHDIAEAATAAAAESDDLLYVLERIVTAARESVARTPSLLSVLREAGVVDAGGQGLFVLLEEVLHYLKGESLTMALPTEMGVAQVESATDELKYGYCTEFILRGEHLNLDEVREKVMSLGDSALVVGDETLIRVHVHTFNPGALLEFATSKGTIGKIKIDNMQEQHEHFLTFAAEPQKTAVKKTAAIEELSTIGVIAVVKGEGLRNVLESLGVSATVPGGQTMNPSTAELLQAIEAVRAEKVIVLPNNPNIVPVAEQARALSTKQVIVVPTHSIPQGIAALLAFNYQADLDANVQAMTRAAQHIQTIEITRATRSVRVNGVSVEAGQPIGLINGQLMAAGPTLEAVVLESLRKIEAGKYEILTIYFGAGVTIPQAKALADEVRRCCPTQEVELVDGGQPYYPYIISAE
jgi:DAK2 domain fusion protein YloV